MFLRLFFAPLVLLVRLLRWPLWAWRRARACTPGAFVELKLEGRIHEGPQRRRRWWPPRVPLRHEARREVRIVALRRLIDEVITDSRVAGVVFALRGVSGGWASFEALRAELARVVTGGKRLVAWLPEGAANREMYVASIASTIVAPPTVDIGLTGIKSEGVYLKRTLDWIGVGIDLHARKEFKSAADRLARAERSDADRAQTEAIVGAIDRALVAALAAGRRVDEPTARAWIDEGPTRASVARQRGLIDQLGHDDDLPRLLGGVLEPAARYLARRRGGRDLAPILPRRRRAIGVVEVHGVITGVASPLARALGPIAVAEQVIADLRAAERDPRIAGVILDVDSPGGTVTASDAMFAAARRLADRKPVIARMGDVAASGGYYVAVAGRAIVARPLTLTGSIGVVAARPIAERLAERLRVHRDVIARGRFADLDAVLRTPTEDERALVAREIDGHYNAFVAHVAEARRRPVDELEPLARGRVYVGDHARAVGLVDELGGFDRALERLREALPGVSLEDRPRVIAAPLPSRRAPTPEKGEETPKITAALIAQLVALLPESIRLPLGPVVAVLGDRAARVLALAPIPPTS